jgi:hypothetical protein
MQHMDLQGTEAAAERDLLSRRNVEAAKNQDVAVKMRAMQTREIRIIERPTEIQTDHLCTDRPVNGANLEAGSRGGRR